MSEMWPIPSRPWWQFALAVAAQTVVLGAGFVVVLAALGVVAAVLGVDPSAGITR